MWWPPIAVLAGLVSFLSPCCLPLLPGYLAYVSGTAGALQISAAKPKTNDCPYDSAVSGAGDRSTGEPGLERVGALEWFTSAPAVPET